MVRSLFAVAASMLFASSLLAQANQWVTIKGQVTWPKDAKLPEVRELVVSQDKEECEKDGKLKANEFLVNPKNRGVQNVWVYLRPDSTEKAAKLDPKKDIHPNLLKPAAKTFDVDQPCCMFEPRIFAIREGDFVNFKNSAKISHNTKLDADEPSPSYNKTIASKGNYKDPKPFVAQRTPVQFACTMHPWMGGQFMVFDHPYFAVTDADGKFEIKDAPAGKYRIVYQHEFGYHKGKDGNRGWPITIAAGADGTMALPALELEVSTK